MTMSIHHLPLKSFPSLSLRLSLFLSHLSTHSVVLALQGKHQASPPIKSHLNVGSGSSGVGDGKIQFTSTGEHGETHEIMYAFAAVIGILMCIVIFSAVKRNFEAERVHDPEADDDAIEDMLDAREEADYRRETAAERAAEREQAKRTEEERKLKAREDREMAQARREFEAERERRQTARASERATQGTRLSMPASHRSDGSAMTAGTPQRKVGFDSQRQSHTPQSTRAGSLRGSQHQHGDIYDSLTPGWARKETGLPGETSSVEQTSEADPFIEVPLPTGEGKASRIHASSVASDAGPGTRQSK